MLAAQQSDYLISFLDKYGDLPLDQLAEIITELVREGRGTITKPEAGLHSPATSDWEIECLGIYAKGFDEIHAARNWLKVARAQMYPEAAA